MSKSEKDPLEELVNFITDKRRDVRLIALENIASSTVDKSNFKVLRKTRLVRYLARLIGDSDVHIARAVVPTLINISEDPVFVKQMLAQNVVARVVDAILDGDEVHKLYVILLCNITRDEAGARKLLQANEPLFGFYVSKLIGLFTADTVETGYAWISSIISNITQVSQGRELLLDPERGYLRMLTPYINHVDPVRRIGIIGAIKNCLFENAVHKDLIDDFDLLTVLLFPLRGPEELKPNEREGIPEALLDVDENKQRDDDPECRMMLIECLLLLTSTKYGREKLRTVNAYQILKYCDQAEENSTVSDKIFEIINILEGLTENPDREITFDPLEISKAGYKESAIQDVNEEVISEPFEKKLKDYDEYGEVVEVI